MEKTINGIHHITVMASDPQANYDFYTQTLGMRFIKKTVNFDAPDVYHLYYGDEIGSPGTILTFFPFPDVRRGKRGTGEINIVSFSVTSTSLIYWTDHLAERAVNFDGPKNKFGYEYISILDPDGMKKESIVFIDIIEDTNTPRGISGAGTVHHIAWRTANDEEQLSWREKILLRGLYPTEVVDRIYFHSIYFREPGGILFEIATDPPGFMIDESFENLGTELKLPAWHEPKRKIIEQILIPLKTKSFVRQN